MPRGMRREESDPIVVTMGNDLVVSPVKDEQPRRRVRLRWKWTKSWMGEPITSQLEAYRGVIFSIAARS
jgi:hypothetical protein